MSLGYRDQSYAKRVANQTHNVVHFQALHDFAAVTLDGFHAELEPARYLTRAMSVGNHAQHFDLARREAMKRAPNRNCM
jgi:hypothetical protein